MRSPAELSHAKVAAAIADGTLTRQPCETCGAVPADAHHEDYDKPLEVVWLCRSHHKQLHGSGPGKSISIDQEVYDALEKHAQGLSDTPNKVLRRILKVDAKPKGK